MSPVIEVAGDYFFMAVVAVIAVVIAQIMQFKSP